MAALFSVVVIAVSYFAAEEFTKRKSGQVLELAQSYVESTLHACISSHLAFTANIILEQMKTARPYSHEYMQEIADRYGLDELSIAGTNGLWVASTDASAPGVRLDISASTAAYLDFMADPARSVLSERFRSSATRTAVRMKYLGLKFKDRSGVLQLGYYENRLAPDVGTDFPGFVDCINVFEDGVVAIIDAETDEVLSTNIPLESFRGLRSDVFKNTEGTYEVRLKGQLYRGRSRCFARHIFVTLLSDENFEDTRRMIIGVPSAVALIFLVLFVVIDRTRIRLAAARQSLQKTEEDRRLAELQLAHSIQKNAMPGIFPAFPDDFTFDLYARTDSAKDVGGDFYDFFRLDGSRLAVVIADVSGKGVPAAMFMMQAKTIIKARVLAGGDLADAAETVNRELCTGNTEDMFVTAWIGVLDTGTGDLTYVNAGHNPPYVRKSDDTLRTLESVSGFVFGGLPDIHYRMFSDRLEPGDLLFLYTDGVTESHNPLGGMFGETALEETLCAKRGVGLARFRPGGAEKHVGAEETVERVRTALKAFSGTAPQFDDVTMLALVYRGAPRTEKCSVPAVLESVATLSAFSERILDENGFGMEVKSDILVALDEIANNVARYSGSPEMTLVVETAELPKTIRLTMIDTGTPWDPLGHLDPDITLSAEERGIGGLGILMVKKLMDGVAYERDGDRNVFSFRKSERRLRKS